MTIEYKNFEIDIRRDGRRLRAQLRSDCSPHGLSDLEIKKDLTSQELEQLATGGQLDLVGKKLYRYIFHAESLQDQDDVLPGDTLHLRLAVDRAVLNREKDQRIRIIFRAAPNALP